MEDHSKDNDPRFHEFHPRYERDAEPPKSFENPHTNKTKDKHMQDKWENDMEKLNKFEHMTSEHKQHFNEDIAEASHSKNPAEKLANFSKAAAELVVEGVESIPREFYAQKAANERPDVHCLQEEQN